MWLCNVSKATIKTQIMFEFNTRRALKRSNLSVNTQFHHSLIRISQLELSVGLNKPTEHVWVTDAVCRPQFQAHSQSSCLRWEGHRYWARNRCSLCGLCEQGAPSVLVNFRANSDSLSLWSTHDPVRQKPAWAGVKDWVSALSRALPQKTNMLKTFSNKHTASLKFSQLHLEVCKNANVWFSF